MRYVRTCYGCGYWHKSENGGYYRHCNYGSDFREKCPRWIEIERANKEEELKIAKERRKVLAN